MSVVNLMSVDLEDYYCDLPFEEWSDYRSRVEENTRIILDLFEKYNTKSTFFVLGYIAEKFPHLIHEILERGHEIASHGYAHLDVRKAGRENFEKDLVRSIEAIKKVTGKEVLGFRAPFCSIDKTSFWAVNILSKYVKYDSSIFPVRTPLYGVPDAPRFIYRPSLENPIINDKDSNLIEIPLATHRLPIIGNVPIAGGFHMRFLPYWYIKLGIKSLNKQNQPATFYIHPKDLDPGMPKIKKYGWHYYYGLKSARNKFENLLRDFKFTSVKEALAI